MKKLVFSSLMCLLLLACSKNNVNSRNPFLPDYRFDTGNLINTVFPEYYELTLTGGKLELDGFGIKGIVVYFSGNFYSAFELTDPNHTIQTCSKLNINGIIATCSCDDGNSYEIINGLPLDGTTGQYPLKRYFVEVNGNIIRVYNN